MKELKNWLVTKRDIETDHNFYEPKSNKTPIILSNYGRYYQVKGFWAIESVLWLDLRRSNKAGVLVEAQLTPDELMEMELGLCDEEELNQLLKQKRRK